MAFKLSWAEILAALPTAGREPGPWHTRTAMQESPGGRREDIGGRVRVSVSRACGDGAPELRGEARRGRLRNLERRAVADRRPDAVAKPLGLKPEQVKINMLYAGGSFGRRANPPPTSCWKRRRSPRHGGAASRPVKLIWTREDDMRAGQYRPDVLSHAEAGLDADGNIVAWQHRLVGQSIVAGTTFEAVMVKDGIDVTSVEGASTCRMPCRTCGRSAHHEAGVPVQWWRSVGSTHTAFLDRSFSTNWRRCRQGPGGVSPFAARKHPRHLGVLELAAAKAGWGKPLARQAGEKRGRGIAVHESFNRFVAQVAEVSVARTADSSRPRGVRRDCGIAVNPDIVRAQMEGGIGFGLSAALYGAITLKDGQSSSRTSTTTRCCASRHAADRGAHRAFGGQANGVGEPAAADRTGGGQRDRGGDRKAAAQPAAPLLLRRRRPLRRRPATPCTRPRAFVRVTGSALVVLPDTALAFAFVERAAARRQRRRDPVPSPTLGEAAGGRRRRRPAPCLGELSRAPRGGRSDRRRAPAPGVHRHGACAPSSSRCPSRRWPSPARAPRSSNGTGHIATAARAGADALSAGERAKECPPAASPPIRASRRR